MTDKPVQFYNRRTRTIETEHVYGEAWLRFIYGNPLGKLALHTLVKRAAFSRWYGKKMDTPQSTQQIRPFIEKYAIPVDEIAEPLDSFKNFNAFFARKLKPQSRPLASSPNAVIFPADARHLLIPDVSAVRDLFIKGQRFDLEALLADVELSRQFSAGSAVISRLCPVDYHRFHFPLDGTPHSTRRVAGDYFSVSPLALSAVPNILWKNVRTLTLLDNTLCGNVLLIEVGATCVGSITQTYTPDRPVTKGTEKGYFTFGASTTITLFQKNTITFSADLVEQSRNGRELYARMGETMGTVLGYASF